MDRNFGRIRGLSVFGCNPKGCKAAQCRGDRHLFRAWPPSTRVGEVQSRFIWEGVRLRPVVLSDSEPASRTLMLAPNEG